MSIDIICDSCSEPATTYADPACLDNLEGKAFACASCGDSGRIYLHEPDGGDCFDARLCFRSLEKAS